MIPFLPVRAENPGSEGRNLFLLLSLVVLIPMVWWLLLGWRPPFLIDQHDNLQMGYVYLQQFARVGGDWKALLYWPGMLGGSRVHDVTGSLPIVQLLVSSGASPLLTSNLLVFFVQVLFAYFCVRASLGLSRVIFGARPVETPVVILLLAGLFAFLPLLGWRLTWGHESIVFGLFVFLCMTTLLLDEVTGERSAITVLIALITLAHAFQFNGYQLILYSILLGAPLIVGLATAVTGMSWKHRFRWFRFPVAVYAAALLISLPKFAGMLANALGGEMGRTGGEEVIYSYTVATLGDWLASIPWTTAFIPSSRQAFTYQEVNYPLGPLVLLLFLVKPSRPYVRLLSGMAISLLLAVIISMNIQPLSTLLITVIPLLDSFRVPARSILPLLLFTSTLAAAILLKTMSVQDRPVRPVFQIIALLVAAVLAFSPAPLNDILVTGVIGCLFLLKDRSTLRSEAALICLALLAGSAVSAFRERINPPLQNPVSSSVVTPIRDAVLSQAPELASPLSRIYSNLQLRGTGFNSLMFMDLSSLTGYWFPLRRYSELNAALNDKPWHSATSVFHNHESDPGFHALNTLYNVGHTLTFDNGHTVVTPLGRPWGQAWFSGPGHYVTTWKELAQTLSRNILRDDRNLLLLRSDPDVLELPETGRCQTSRITRTTNATTGLPIRIEFSSDGQCALIVAMNYTRILKVSDQTGRSLRTFPAYGALLGVMVEPDSHMVRIDAQATSFPGLTLLWVAGLILAAVLLFQAFRSRGPVQPLTAHDEPVRLRITAVPDRASLVLPALNTQRFLIAVLLILLAGSAAYMQVASHHFVWDTIPFVIENPWLQDPGTSDLIAMFTQAHRANWQPLVWLSHSLDFLLFGTDAGKHHLVNLLFHLANAVLVYLLVLYLLIRADLSVYVKGHIALASALIFVLHPQHVESVAWVVERKDVLYGLFYLASLVTWIRYRLALHPTRLDRFYPLALFILSLASKPMAVTLPVVLVLLDFYPLRQVRFNVRDLTHSVLCKWHYFALALLVMLVTLKTQSMAMPEAGQLPAWARAVNALNNIGFYIGHYLVPTQLSPFYPYPGAETLSSPSFWLPVTVFILFLSGLCIYLWRRGIEWPGLLWICYLVTLLPVSGLIQVGPAKATDHYTYLVTLPLAILTGIGIGYALSRSRLITWTLTLTYVLFLFLITRQQVTYWNNPLSLWTRVVQLYPESAYAHRNLAAAWDAVGDTRTALIHAERSLRLGGPVEEYVRTLRERTKSTPQ